MFGFGDKARKEYSRLHSEGSNLIKAERYAEALPPLSEATRIYPQGHGAHASLAIVLNKLGRHAEAADVATQCLALSPDFTGAFFQRAVARRALGDYNGAVADYSVYLDLKPDNCNARIMRGLAWLEMGRHTEALGDFDFLCRQEPAHMKHFLHAGICLRNLERWPEALERLNRAEELGPQNHVFYWHRSYAFEGLGRSEDALAEIERAIAISPQDPEPPRRRLELLERMGRADQAAAGRALLNAKRDQHIEEVSQRGQFVCAAIIQANEEMHDVGNHDWPGTVAFTFSPGFPGLANQLTAIAKEVFNLKHQQVSDPETAALGKVTTREYGTSERVRVPMRMTGGMEVFCQAVTFHRDFLPSGKLDLPWVPCAADPGSAGEIVHLPWSAIQHQASAIGIDLENPPKQS